MEFISEVVQLHCTRPTSGRHLEPGVPDPRYEEVAGEFMEMDGAVDIIDHGKK